MTLDPLATLLSAAAIVVSIWAARKAHSASAQQNLLQERLLKLESVRERDRLAASKRANLRAEIAKAGSNWYLVILNDGPGHARAVQVLVDDKTLLEHDRILCRREDVVTTLGPGAPFRYPMSIAMGSPLVYSVSLSWEDESGEPGRWESQLHI